MAGCPDEEYVAEALAVGAVGYFLLTGKPVFESERVVEVCADHIHKAPTPPSGIS